MPFSWLYCPVRMQPRLGALIELVTQQRSMRIPSRPMRSMLGVDMTFERMPP